MMPKSSQSSRHTRTSSRLSLVCPWRSNFTILQAHWHLSIAILSRGCCGMVFKGHAAELPTSSLDLVDCHDLTREWFFFKGSQRCAKPATSAIATIEIHARHCVWSAASCIPENQHFSIFSVWKSDELFELESDLLFQFQYPSRWIAHLQVADSWNTRDAFRFVSFRLIDGTWF